MSSSKQKVQKLEYFNNERNQVYSTSLKILSHWLSLPWESVGYTARLCHKSFAPWIFVPKTDICPQNISEVREISLKVVLKEFYLVPVQFLSHRILFTSTLYP